MCACLCVCVCVCRGFLIKVGVTLPILLLFCLFLVIFLSIGLCPFMMNYDEFFSPCPLFLVSLGVYFTVPVRATDSVTRKKKDHKKLSLLALKSIHTNTCSQQHPQLRANQHPRHTCENRCL